MHFPEANNAGTANTTISLIASQAKAHEIMGENFFGIEEARKHFGLNPSKWQLAYMEEVPFSEEVLRACKDTHILVAYIPISIVSVRAKTANIELPENHQHIFFKQDWYDENAVGNGESELKWYLVLKTPVPDSKSKLWQAQKILVDSTKTDEVPEANVMVYTIIGHFLETGVRLFENEHVRTNTLCPRGGHVHVGPFFSVGFSVNSWGDDVCSDRIGVSACRKIEA